MYRLAKRPCWGRRVGLSAVNSTAAAGMSVARSTPRVRAHQSLLQSEFQPFLLRQISTAGIGTIQFRGTSGTGSCQYKINSVGQRRARVEKLSKRRSYRRCPHAQLHPTGRRPPVPGQPTTTYQRLTVHGRGWARRVWGYGQSVEPGTHKI